VRLGCFTACHVDAANLGDNPLHPDPAVRRATTDMAATSGLLDDLLAAVDGA
jgi:hypothetical protein